MDFTAVAVDDFTVLQIDLAKDMQLNGVYYIGNKLETIRKKDAVFVKFPKVNRETMFNFRVHYEGKPRESSKIPFGALAPALASRAALTPAAAQNPEVSGLASVPKPATIPPIPSVASAIALLVSFTLRPSTRAAPAAAPIVP